MLAMGIVTYVSVFNLNTFITLGRRGYHTQKHLIIEIMKKDDRESWARIGKKFDTFKPTTDLETKPSEWLLLWYYLLRGLNFLRRRQNRRKQKNREVEDPV